MTAVKTLSAVGLVLDFLNIVNEYKHKSNRKNHLLNRIGLLVTERTKYSVSIAVNN